jgi:hypothetical protein
MSWSDDTRCLYCDGKLPLYRKLTNGQFCSTPHQKAYWKEQERLAVEVLHRTHDALMAYRPQEDVELIIGPAVGWNGSSQPATPTPQEPPVQVRVERPREPVMETARPVPAPAPVAQTHLSEPAPPPFADFLASNFPEGLAPRWTVLPLLEADDPSPCEAEFLELIRPNGETPRMDHQLRVTADSLRVPVHAAVVAWAARDVAALPIRPSAPATVASGLEPQSREWKLAPEVSAAPVHIQDEKPIAPPEATAIPSRLVFVDTVVSVDRVAPEPVAFASPLVIVEPTLLSELAVEVPEPVGSIPPSAGWRYRQARVASTACTAPLVERDVAELVFTGQSPQAPVLPTPSAEPFSTGLGLPKDLPLAAAKSDPHARGALLTWFRLGAFNPPRLIGSSLTGSEPRVRLAGGSRYTMNRASQVIFSHPVHALSLGAVASTLAFPELSRNDRLAALQTNFEPDHALLVDLTAWKLEIPARAMKRGSARSRGSGQTLPFADNVWFPSLRLLPLPWASSQPRLEVPAEDVAPAVALPPLPAPPEEHPHLGHLLLGFWKNAPRDLRLLMFAIPALLALAFNQSLPKVHVSTVQATEPVEKNVGQAINGSWSNFKQVVSERAAISLDEDFRSGLDDWASPGGNATEWSFDANGFVRPGSLALYSPSLSLADYEAQFLGLIDQKSLSWVVRAADFSNYYVVKLVVLKPGPLTTLGLTRYAVIDGKPRDRVDAVVPFTARPDMLYRVRMDVHDDSFVLAIQGQMVDAWSEPRLKKGGIGFFSARGEGSRVRWLQVTHQYDMLGRLCSYLAPYDLSAADVLPTETTTKNNSTKNNGSWQR